MSENRTVASTFSGSGASCEAAACRKGTAWASSCGAVAAVIMCVFAVEFHVRSPRDVLGQVMSVFGPDLRVSALTQYQRGGADKGQHLTHVDGHVHPVQGLE